MTTPIPRSRTFSTNKVFTLAGRLDPAGAMLASPPCALRIWSTNTIYDFATIDFAIAEC
jgi:hypothetical protein